MTPRTRTVLAALAAALALAAVVGWALRPGPPSPGAPAAAVQMPVPEAAGIAPAERIQDAEPALHARPSTSAPLPPPDAPLAQMLPDLVRRADAGDRKAACRLSLELLRCTHLADWESIDLPDPDGGVTAPNAQLEAAVADSIDNQRLWHLERQMACREVPASLRGQGSRYLAQAARAGEPEAMLRYADGHHWPPSGRGIFADPGFDAWRREAPAMLQRALAAGTPEAAFLLSVAYSDDFGLLPALVPNDPEQALAMRMLYQRALGRSESLRFPANMSASTVARARERAEQMHQQYFGGRKRAGQPSLLQPFFVAPQAGTQPRFCEDD